MRDFQMSNQQSSLDLIWKNAHSNAMTIYVYTCLYLLMQIYVIANGNERTFVRQPGLDDFLCTTDQEFGQRRSKVMCSEACAKEPDCIGFFYNSADNTCYGTSLIHTDPAMCVFKQWTVYYKDEIGELPFTCEYSWQEFEGHCYKIEELEMDWVAAKIKCSDSGGYLLSIETQEEQLFIASAFPAGGYWIGGNDITINNLWKWDSGNAITYDNWDDLEPSDTTLDSDCMRARTNWKWHDVACSLTYKSVCEKEPTSAGK